MNPPLASKIPLADPRLYVGLALARQTRFETTARNPHAVLDDFLSQDVGQTLAQSYPGSKTRPFASDLGPPVFCGSPKGYLSKVFTSSITRGRRHWFFLATIILAGLEPSSLVHLAQSDPKASEAFFLRFAEDFTIDRPHMNLQERRSLRIRPRYSSRRAAELHGHASTTGAVYVWSSPRVLCGFGRARSGDKFEYNGVMHDPIDRAPRSSSDLEDLIPF